MSVRLQGHYLSLGMRISVRDLKLLVRSRVLLEAQHYPEIALMDGSVVEYGSHHHVSEMETMVKSFETVRDQQRKGTAARATFAAAARLLKAQIRNASGRPKKRQPTIPEQEPEELDERGLQNMGIGVGGAAGHGRYSPGSDVT